MDKSKLLMIVIIVLLVVLLGTVAGVSIYAFNIMKTQSQATEGQTGPGGVVVTKVLTVDQITKINLDSAILTNLARNSDGSEHFIKIEFSVGVDNTKEKDSEAIITALNDNQIVIRDVIISLLNTKSKEVIEADDGNGLAVLKDEIVKQLQIQFGSNLIVQVYVGNYTFQ